MDKVKFVKDVFGDDFPKIKEYVKNVDNVLDFLPYPEQLVIRLKYNKIPFTKLCRIMCRKTSWDTYRYVPGGVSSTTARNIYRFTLQKLKRDSTLKRIWEGELFGDIAQMSFRN